MVAPSIAIAWHIAQCPVAVAPSSIHAQPVPLVRYFVEPGGHVVVVVAVAGVRQVSGLPEVERVLVVAAVVAMVAHGLHADALA